MSMMVNSCRFGSVLSAFPQVAGFVPTAFAMATESHLVSMPASVPAGALLRTALQVQANSLTTISTPSGWTLLWGTDDIDAPFRFGSFVKVAAGDEGGTSVNFVTSSATSGAAHCHMITNWYGSLPGVAAGGPNQFNSNNTVTVPNLSPGWGAGNTLWIIEGGARDDDGTVIVFPEGYSGLTTVSGGGFNAGASVFSAFQDLNAASVGSGVVGLSEAEAWICNRIAIREAA